MSFETEIYPYRNNRLELPRRLLERVDSEFTEIVHVPGHNRETLGGRRCHLRLKGSIWNESVRVHEECDYRAVLTDKKVAKALLYAWLGKISDLYLDAPTLRLFERVKYKNVKDALDNIEKLAPAGAVMSLAKELTGYRWLFGDGVAKDTTYNRYFSTLIAWDSVHCFGLVQRLDQLSGRLALGGGSGVHYALQAAVRYIHKKQRDKSNVYHWVATY